MSRVTPSGLPTIGPQGGVCRHCLQQKGAEEFYRTRGGWYLSYCRACYATIKAEGYRAGRAKAIAATPHAKRPPKPPRPYKPRERTVDRDELVAQIATYAGVSIEDYEDRYAAQDGACLKCRTPEEVRDPWRWLYVVRSGDGDLTLLCGHCRGDRWASTASRPKPAAAAAAPRVTPATTRVCPDCGKRKAADAYTRKRDGKLATYCRPCYAARVRASRRRKLAGEARARRTPVTPPGRVVTGEEYEAALAAQGGLCACCLDDLGRGQRPEFSDVDDALAIVCAACARDLDACGYDPARAGARVGGFIEAFSPRNKSS